MKYSVVTTVVAPDPEHNGRFLLYKHGEHHLIPLSQNEADKLLALLNEYPDVFSDSRVIEIKNAVLPDQDLSENIPDFYFQNVSDKCPGLMKKLTDTFDNEISGIDRNFTAKRLLNDNFDR